MPTLAETVKEKAAVGSLWEPLDGYRIRCTACAHRCPIPVGFSGVCKVRFNSGGKLYVPWGYVINTAADPIEKRPFFHVLPGARTFSFGMLGCSLHCSYCQNWVTSQALRDPLAFAPAYQTTPEALIDQALAQGAEGVFSSYNEPLITAEWAVAIFRRARAAGLMTGFVSNGYVTPEALEYLQPWVQLYKVDFKTFNDRNYHRLGCRLQPVLDGLRMIHQMGFWLEVVTLVVPGFNDSEDELRKIAEFLASISPDIPWHVTAFHSDYKMQDIRDTTPADLERAAATGREAGLHYVYAGNLPGQVGNLENTYCPHCGALLIRRCGIDVRECSLTREGRCPNCSEEIPGIWADPLERKAAHAAEVPWLAHYCG